WGYFAMGADWALSQKSRWRPLLVALAPSAVTHVLILSSWWLVFRWVARGTLGWASVAVVLGIGVGAALVVAVARQRGAGLELRVAAPRMLASALFGAVLVLDRAAGAAFWLHAGAVAVPYLYASAPRWRLRGTNSRAARRAATARFPEGT